MKQTHMAKGAALMLTSSILFCLMAVLIKYASGIDSYKITLFRFIIGLALLGTAAMFGKIKLTFIHGPFLFLRGFIGSIAVFIFYLSIPKLGLGKATVIGYCFPIFAAVFSHIFLKEKLTVIKAAAILTAFIGIYLLTANGIAGPSWAAAFGKYELLAVFGAVLGGIAVVLIKKLHDTDSSYAIFFAQCAIGLWLLIVPATVVPSDIGYTAVALLLSIGVTATVGQLLMTQGYNYVSVATGSLLGMLTPVLNYVIGVMIFHELISLRSIIGSGVIIASCAVVLLANDKL